MAVPYERYENEIEVQAEEESTDSETGSTDETQTQRRRREVRQQQMKPPPVLVNGWPTGIGCAQIICGFCLATLGAAEVFLVPLLENNRAYFSIDKHNGYGVGLFCGALQALVGTIGCKSALRESGQLVIVYFVCVVFSLLAHVVFILVIIVGFSEGSTTPHGYPHNSVMFPVHMAVVGGVVVGFFLVLLAFTQYYEDVLFGEVMCCKRTIHCLCPCCCPPPVTPEQLLEDGTARPPSLPV